jgi:hypothetical protein
MDLLTVLLLAALTVIPLAAIWILYRLSLRLRLRHRFGPEYDRVVLEMGDVQRAEYVLRIRERRVRSLRIRPLSPQQRSRFAEAWRNLQHDYQASPATAVTEAEHLLFDVLVAHGYLPGDRKRAAEDLSVHHARVVENCRAALTITERSRRSDASTDDLRKAMVHFRAIFEDLIGEIPQQSTAADRAG